MHVLAVADQLRDDVLPIAGGADQARLAVVDGRHGVEQVRHMACAMVEYRAGLLVICVRVRDGNRAYRAGLFGKVSRAIQLGRHVHDPDQAAAAALECLEGLEARKSQVRTILGALLLFGEERPLHVDTHHPGAALRPVAAKGTRCLKGLRQRLVGQRHGSGREGGHSAAGQVSRHALQSSGVAIREIGPGIPVGVYVHQPGKDFRPAKVHCAVDVAACADLQEAPVLHMERAGDKALWREDSGIFIPHDITSAFWQARGGDALADAACLFIRQHDRDLRGELRIFLPEHALAFVEQQVPAGSGSHPAQHQNGPDIV